MYELTLKPFSPIQYVFYTYWTVLIKLKKCVAHTLWLPTFVLLTDAIEIAQADGLFAFYNFMFIIVQSYLTCLNLNINMFIIKNSFQLDHH